MHGKFPFVVRDRDGVEAHVGLRRVASGTRRSSKLQTASRRGGTGTRRRGGGQATKQRTPRAAVGGVGAADLIPLSTKAKSEKEDRVAVASGTCAIADQNSCIVLLVLFCFGISSGGGGAGRG